jgi:hypothetical protein
MGFQSLGFALTHTTLILRDYYIWKKRDMARVFRTADLLRSVKRLGNAAKFV